MAGRSRTRRVAGMAAASVTLAATILVGGATVASSDEEPEHTCDLAIGRQDNGPLIDPLHHNLEPLVPQLHPVNCQIQTTIDSLSCSYLPFLAFLRSTSPISC